MARGNITKCSHQKGAIIRGNTIIRGRQSLQILLKKKIFTSNKLNMGLILSVPNLVPWLIFNVNILRHQRLNHHWSVLLHQTPLQLCLLSKLLIFNLPKKNKRWWEGWGWLFKGGDYLKYFRQGGGGGFRWVIIRGRRLQFLSDPARVVTNWTT